MSETSGQPAKRMKPDDEAKQAKPDDKSTRNKDTATDTAKEELIRQLLAAKATLILDPGWLLKLRFLNSLIDGAVQ